MKPQQFFHDHPVIDKRDDGYHMYWTPMPPVLLRNPIRYSPEDLDLPDQYEQTTSPNDQDN